MNLEINKSLREQVAGKRIFVGLSGGVDSAVSAALLQEAEASVVGVFLQGWYPPGQPCSWREDRRDAMRVAAHLGLPFRTLDVSQEYKTGVIDYLLAEYAAGRTPNPDVMCNREVKFGAFYRYAKELGADLIATGHYASNSNGSNGVSHPFEEPVALLRGMDDSKDQSYFLWAVPKEVLRDTIFPVGTMPKSDVRELAKRFNLPVAEKKDSQGVCFLGSISVSDFLRQEIGTTTGDAFEVRPNGAKQFIGRHDGAILYTLGERVALIGTMPGPWFVIDKDMQRNSLTVSREGIAHEPQESIALRDENWFTDPSLFLSLHGQYRYHGERISGRYDTTRHAFIPHDTLSAAISSGQSLVLYDGDRCIGGGIIV